MNVISLLIFYNIITNNKIVLFPEIRVEKSGISPSETGNFICDFRMIPIVKI